ncbi:hypothetical protein JB92DRAFT_2000998 [Gautieria morchelliformis]|nr:hypothetical protein JB92DRAFT_2000998 [Gautieria morchelliformis]
MPTYVCYSVASPSQRRQTLWWTFTLSHVLLRVAVNPAGRSVHAVELLQHASHVLPSYEPLLSWTDEGNAWTASDHAIVPEPPHRARGLFDITDATNDITGHTRHALRPWGETVATLWKAACHNVARAFDPLSQAARDDNRQARRLETLHLQDLTSRAREAETEARALRKELHAVQRELDRESRRADNAERDLRMYQLLNGQSLPVSWHRTPPPITTKRTHGLIPQHLTLLFLLMNIMANTHPSTCLQQPRTPALVQRLPRLRIWNPRLIAASIGLRHPPSSEPILICLLLDSPCISPNFLIALAQWV